MILLSLSQKIFIISLTGFQVGVQKLIRNFDAIIVVINGFYLVIEIIYYVKSDHFIFHDTSFGIIVNLILIDYLII